MYPEMLKLIDTLKKHGYTAYTADNKMATLKK